VRIAVPYIFQHTAWLAEQRLMSRYTKSQLEELFYRQYEYIEQLNERIQLLQEQNVIYRSLNKKLTQEQLDKPQQKFYTKKKGDKSKSI
jgi:hypothetical protein